MLNIHQFSREWFDGLKRGVMQRFCVCSDVGSRHGTSERDRGLDGRHQSGAGKAAAKAAQDARDKLAVLVATMLHVRSANLVELAAGLPRESDRWDMGYQWISRFLAHHLVCCDTVMEPFAREILARLAETGEPIPLILDQTKACTRYQILMLSVRWGALRQAQERSAAGLAG